MSESLSIILIAVFSIHLMVFSGLYYHRRKKHYLLFVLLFFLLVLSNALRLWGPHLRLFSYEAYDYLRFAAWITTVFAVIAWVKQMRKK